MTPQQLKKGEKYKHPEKGILVYDSRHFYNGSLYVFRELHSGDYVGLFEDEIEELVSVQGGLFDGNN